MQPTSDYPARPRRIELDTGEIVDLDETLTGNGWVQPRMPAMRALDLAEVLAAYDRIVGVVLAAAEVSTTEEGLVRALRDVGGVARARPAAGPVRRTPVTEESRLLAMAMLQESKPGLSHTALVGVVDAAARWIEQDKHDFALGVVEAAAGEQVAPAVWTTLLGQRQGGSFPADSPI